LSVSSSSAAARVAAGLAVFEDLNPAEYLVGAAPPLVSLEATNVTISVEADQTVNLVFNGTSAETVVEANTPLEGLSGLASSRRYFMFILEGVATDLSFTTSGGSGQFSLCVFRADIDFNECVLGSEDVVEVPAAPSGTWTILLEGLSEFSGVTLEVATPG